MAWIESHQSLAKHKKLLRLSGILRTDRVALIGHLHLLWWWGIDNADIDGRLGDVTPYEIAQAAEWTGDPSEFVDALVQAGFVERDEGDYVLHDWYDYAGKLNEAREKERERSRRRRAQNRGATAQRPPVDHRSTTGRPPDDRQTTAGTQPNQTNQTNQEEERARADATRTRLAAADDPAPAAAEVIGDDSVEPMAFYESLWGARHRTVDRLVAGYVDKLRASALKWAMWQAYLAGAHGARYLSSILERLVAQGLTTAEAAEEHERARRGARTRASPSGNGTCEGAPNAGAYRPVDPGLVDRWRELYPEEVV